MNRLLRIGIALFGAGVLLTVIFITVANQVNAQNDVVAELKTRLEQRGVPVKSIQVKSRLPFQLEIELQSQSDNQLASPDDPVFEALVQREMAVASRRDVVVDAVKVTILNKDGTAIFWAELPVRRISKESVPSISAEAGKVIRQQLVLNGFTMESLEVTDAGTGERVLSVRLVASSVQLANKAIPSLMQGLPQLVNTVNTERGAAITTIKLDLADSGGKPLLKYVFDLELEKENWWQAEGITQDWFPHPPPSTP